MKTTSVYRNNGREREKYKEWEREGEKKEIKKWEAESEREEGVCVYRGKMEAGQKIKETGRENVHRHRIIARMSERQRGKEE